MSVVSYNHSRRTPVYASFDVETDGDCPFLNSLRSIGIALFLEHRVDGEIVGRSMVDTFYVNIKPRDGMVISTECYDNFWKKHPEQWRTVHLNAKTPENAIRMVSEFIQKHSNYIFKWVSKPASVDWMFLKCYYGKYKPEGAPKIGFACWCMNSLLCVYKKQNHIGRDQQYGFMKRLSEDFPYTHNALDDAIYQGVVYMNLRRLIEQH